jgi:hypothetical protein
VCDRRSISLAIAQFFFSLVNKCAFLSEIHAKKKSKEKKFTGNERRREKRRTVCIGRTTCFGIIEGGTRRNEIKCLCIISFKAKQRKKFLY